MHTLEGLNPHTIEFSHTNSHTPTTYHTSTTTPQHLVKLTLHMPYIPFHAGLVKKLENVIFTNLLLLSFYELPSTESY